MKPLNTIKEVRESLKAVKSGCAGDTIFGAKALLFMSERLVAIEALLAKAAAPKKKRAASRWNRFFAAGMKDGKPPAQISAEWKARRGGVQ